MSTHATKIIGYTCEDLNGHITRMSRVSNNFGITIKHTDEGYIWEIRNDRTFETAEEALASAQRFLGEKEKKETDEEFIWEPLFAIGRRVAR